LVYHDLEECEHPSREGFFEATKSRLKHDHADARRALRLNPDDSKFQTHIAFDQQSDITTVGVCSIVYGVTKREAEELICRAKPLNWSDSPGAFFKSIKAGRLVGEDFDEDNSVLANKSYQIQEEVEWNWGPQLESTGSMINVLEIDDLTEKGLLKDQKAASDHAHDVFRVTDPNKILSDYPFDDFASVPKIDYTYRLVRCVLSKFLSSWVPGGLDVDDGRYVAVWCPDRTGEHGAFLTTVQKQIHYSLAAEREAYPQFSQILNLLAPAVITMLLKELAFNSTVTFINDFRLEPEKTSCLLKQEERRG
jgi:hypothetical protein